MSEADQLTAAVAALTAFDANPYTLGDLARLTTPPDYYTEVTLSRRYGGEQRNGGGSGVTGYRLTTRAVAKTENNAREMRRRAASIENTRLGTSTPVAFETEDAIGPDDGWHSGLTSWTFAV